MANVLDTTTPRKPSKIRKTKRGKRKSSVCTLNVFSNNFAGLKHKMTSFTSELKNFNSGIFTGQETHATAKGTFKVPEFELFEAIRKVKENGGSIIGVHKAMKPVLVEEYSEEFELIVVEIVIANKHVRVMTGYGPQEYWKPHEKQPFFDALEIEVVKAELVGCSVYIQIDANSKLGPAYISHDKKQSPNGKILAGIVDRQKLVVGNGMKQCKGTITRKRVTVESVEESSIDIVLMSEDLANEVEEVFIDTEREHSVMRVTKNKEVPSDHNTIVTKFKLKWNNQMKQQKTDMFNLKNKECLMKFKEETSGNNKLSKIFDERGDFNIITEKFMKKFNKGLHKCFRKIGIKEKKTETDQERMYKLWKSLKDKADPSSKKHAELLETKMSDNYFDKIKEATKDINCEEGGMSSGKLWALKKQLCPRTRDPPTGMLDTSGNLVTDEDKIAEMALNHYEKVLENKPMKETLSHIKDAKEILSEKLMEIARRNKTPPWNMKELDAALKHLKEDKSRDPEGIANEVFLLENSGDDMKLAILKLMNRIKKEQIYPKCLRKCNISSIWKKKGPRNLFDSYRGIFRIQVFRAILDILIYLDEYPNIDKNLTDCNVGARKQRNIRDNIFVLNAITNSVQKQSEDALDCQLYDVFKCFDSLWLNEVINCLFSAGFQNDKLPLIFLENEFADIAVKTATKVSKRKTISKIIMQGTIWGSLCCVVLMDKLGKIAYNDPSLLYYYRGVVACPPLEMVDDVAALQKCNNKSRRVNAVINSFMDLEKLKLSKTKCHKIHIGKPNQSCPELKVHDEPMCEVSCDKYLGDKIHKSGSVKPNIEERRAKGFGRSNEILALVKEAPLGCWKLTSGFILRQAMLINGTLFNSEAWHGVTLSDVESLEKVDECLIRGLVKGHSKMPIPAIFLETGQAPLRFVLASRRILYLQTILKRDSTELTSRILRAQIADPLQGDFCLLVEQDMDMINLKMTHEEIHKTSKNKLKKIVKQKVRSAAFVYLSSVQAEKSKMDNLKYHKLETMEYMKSPLFSRDDASLLLSLRTRCVKGIRSDFPGMFVDKNCPVNPNCGTIDNLEHVLSCSKLWENLKDHNITTHRVQFKDIYSKDINKQKAVTSLYSQLLEERDKIMESQPAAVAGPLP